MNHANRVACCLLSLALLSGCDILGKIPLTPKDALRAAGKFGQATREKVEETAEGTVYRLVVESKRSANWLEADRAMWTDLKHSCPQGQLHETLSTRPEDLRDESRLKHHDAGTVFVRTIRCAPRFPFEFDVAPGIPAERVMSDMYRSLALAGLGDTGELMMSPIHASAHTTRYHQMQETLAFTVHSRLADCPQGVAIRNLTMGVMPPAPEIDGQSRPDAVFGFITECIAASPPATIAPAPGS